MTTAIPDETKYRMMMRRGSTMLLNALRPVPADDPKPVRKTLPPPKRKPRPRVMCSIPKTSDTVPAEVRKIIAAVAERFDLTVEAMIGRGRSRHSVIARAVACRLIRERTWSNGLPRHTIQRIGQFLNRDHSSICHALDSFEIYTKHFPEALEMYLELRAELGGRP